jgi:putative transposase
MESLNSDMQQSQIYNYLHVVFATKYRRPLITPAREGIIHDILRSELSKQQCLVDALNGMPDHINLLIRLHPTTALSDVIGRIKGTTSYRINREFPASIPFAWQDGYYAVSVSPFGCERVIAYIRNQKRHHSTGSCKSELEWA